MNTTREGKLFKPEKATAIFHGITTVIENEDFVAFVEKCIVKD